MHSFVNIGSKVISTVPPTLPVAGLRGVKLPNSEIHNILPDIKKTMMIVNA